MMRTAIVVLFCSISAAVYGQGLGIYYTKNGAKLNGDKPQGFRIAYDQGFALGAIIDLAIAPDVELSIQPGYLKIQSVIKVPGINGKLKDTLHLKLDFFSLPILFKIHPEKTERFYFIGGPQLGFLLNSSTTNENGEAQDRSDLFKDLNLSLNFGFGYQIPLKSTFFYVEARYEQGLVNITDFGNPEELFSRTKTQGVNLSLGFGIPFKRKPDE